MHMEDFDCRCKHKEVAFKLGITSKYSECRAYLKSNVCLLAGIAECGEDQNCISDIDKIITDTAWGAEENCAP